MISVVECLFVYLHLILLFPVMCTDNLTLEIYVVEEEIKLADNPICDLIILN